jgi:tRNA threonylcarbamoyladenosine biosynthesis protein TsaE
VDAIVETSASAPPPQWLGTWASEADTQAFAARLAASPAITNATLTLHGDLGAGKTTFVRHLLRALGVQGRIKSPTYAVVEPHEALPCPVMPAGEPLRIWHFDFYRFTDPREWEDAGFRELFASPGLKLVEWPERAEGHLPPIDAQLHLQTQDMPHALNPDIEDAPAARQARFNATSPAGQTLVTALNAA